MEPTTALLGLGANLGDPLEQLRRAARGLGSTGVVEAVSSVYRTEPLGIRDQPDFFNLVCRVRTSLPPRELLGSALRLEAELGRTRSVRDAPRTVDIDLLDYGERVLDEPGLIVPHPRMHRRAFVLIPLAELAPSWRHPRLGLTAAELLEGGGVEGRVERWGELFSGE